MKAINKLELSIIENNKQIQQTDLQIHSHQVGIPETFLGFQEVFCLKMTFSSVLLLLLYK